MHFPHFIKQKYYWYLQDTSHIQALPDHFQLGWSRIELGNWALMEICYTLHLLLLNPRVQSQLSSQLIPKIQQCRTSFDHVVSKTKEPQSKECIYFQSNKHKCKICALPLLYNPTVFNCWHLVSLVIVIINCVAVTKVPNTRSSTIYWNSIDL